MLTTRSPGFHVVHERILDIAKLKRRDLWWVDPG
jgi:hypothetical protein